MRSLNCTGFATNEGFPHEINEIRPTTSTSKKPTIHLWFSTQTVLSYLIKIPIKSIYIYKRKTSNETEQQKNKILDIKFFIRKQTNKQT